MDIKLTLGILSSIVLLGAYVPYIRDIFAKKTKPHIYTWLVWAITQGTGTLALWYGGGGFAAITLFVGLLLVLVVVLLSLTYGTKNITKGDTFVLIAALAAIVVWWQLNNPLLAVLMVSTIDGLGYIPTFRKSFAEPWSETVLFWVAISFSYALALFANSEYNVLTVTYITTQMLADIAIVVLCLTRRRVVPKPVIM